MWSTLVRMIWAREGTREASPLATQVGKGRRLFRGRRYQEAAGSIGIRRSQLL